MELLKDYQVKLMNEQDITDWHFLVVQQFVVQLLKDGWFVKADYIGHKIILRWGA